MHADTFGRRLASMLSVRAAASELGMAQSRVKDHLASGRLHGYKTPSGHWLIPPEAVRTFERRPPGRPVGSRDSRPRQRRWYRRPTTAE